MIFRQLNDPLLSQARQEIAHSPHGYARVVHDGSRLAFYSHHSKAHRLKMTYSTDVGYELDVIDECRRSGGSGGSGSMVLLALEELTQLAASALGQFRYV